MNAINTVHDATAEISPPKSKIPLASSIVSQETGVTMAKPSSFLEPSQRTAPGDLAIVLLARDTYQPITLEQSQGAVDGYAEGAVLNTRFGSFPHSTLLDVPWGSQIRASAVDTGSRGRKRRRETTGEETSTPGQETPGHETPGQATPVKDEDEKAPTKEPAKKPIVASSGFIHLLRPTPELWTSALPHRTQVVYTPDYSYILSRIRARPGTRIIEAGAGSGSFTHASARAVYNGYPKEHGDAKGKVFSFEFNEARFHKMREEITGHHLDGIVQIQHRDVYEHGFLVDGGKSPQATAVFLDLPAPWKAIRHLSRRKRAQNGELQQDDSWTSPLEPKKSVHICTFSPCIEQVMETVTELRKQGWIEVDMVEIANRRINVVRDKAGLNAPKDKGFNSTPADVMESVSKLREVNRKTQQFHENQPKVNVKVEEGAEQMDTDTPGTDAENGQANSGAPAGAKPWLGGRLAHRPEAEIKTHTSYLVFAVLPREWSDEEEAAALAKWPCGNEKKTIGNTDKAVRKQEKREMLQGKRKKQKRRGSEA
jgi:tRNA (adenine57-N1/adenine58-N1)-methyltransferase